MLKALMISGFAVIAAGAEASAECSADLLTVTGWTIKPVGNDTNEMTVTLKSNAAKPFRMLDASVGFTDALGGHIAKYSIDRDAKFKADGTYSETKLWGLYTFERLLTLRAEDVTPYACVNAVLYEDGTKEQF